MVYYFAIELSLRLGLLFYGWVPCSPEVLKPASLLGNLIWKQWSFLWIVARGTFRDVSGTHQCANWGTRERITDPGSGL